MDLELLQQALMVEVDHKQIYPAISEYRAYKVIKERCYEGLK